jgi:hypothetical protein
MMIPSEIMRFKVVLEAEEKGGYSVHCPAAIARVRLSKKP